MLDDNKSVPQVAEHGNTPSAEEQGESVTTILVKLLLFAGIPLALVYAVKLFAS